MGEPLYIFSYVRMVGLSMDGASYALRFELVTYSDDRPRFTLQIGGLFFVYLVVTTVGRSFPPPKYLWHRHEHSRFNLYNHTQFTLCLGMSPKCDY